MRLISSARIILLPTVNLRLIDIMVVFKFALLFLNSNIDHFHSELYRTMIFTSSISKICLRNSSSNAFCTGKGNEKIAFAFDIENA